MKHLYPIPRINNSPNHTHPFPWGSCLAWPHSTGTPITAVEKVHAHTTDMIVSLSAFVEYPRRIGPLAEDRGCDTVSIALDCPFGYDTGHENEQYHPFEEDHRRPVSAGEQHPYRPPGQCSPSALLIRPATTGLLTLLCVNYSILVAR